MLGYVKVNKGELKVKEYEVYKGVYCSLCKTLGKEYGQLMRMILSYDVTFLIIVLLCVQNLVPKFKKGVCPFNITKKCNYCTNCENEFIYAASVSVMLFYFKIKDNIEDSGFFKSLAMRIIYPYAKYKFNKAAKKYPDLALDISVLMMEQNENEKSNTKSVDLAADASAKALGKIFSYFNKDDDNLYSFGYSLGRWVYLLDAADDIKKDLKSGSFNVYINLFSIENEDDYTDEIKQEIKQILYGSIGPGVEYLKKMKLNYLARIINNVISYGIHSVMKTILEGKSVNEGSI